MIFRFTLTGPKGNEYPGYGIWDGLRAFWYPNSIQSQNDEEEVDFDFSSSNPFSKSYVWYDTIMTFQSDLGLGDCFTMHNTKIHKKNINQFDKALKFKNASEEASKCSLVADVNTPVPLLLFLTLSRTIMV